jgi:hypothetical protein
MPVQKAASLIGMAVSTLADPYDVLEAALRKHLIGCHGQDADRDIDSIDVEVYPDGRAYCGKWQGHLRVTAAVVIENTTVAKVLLIGTKGPVVADYTLFGQSGPNVGNSTLIARLFHITLFALRSTGITRIENDPYDPRVRKRYEDMGFENGERLRLNDVTQLRTAFEFIEEQYKHPALSGRLSLASPPMPL